MGTSMKLGVSFLLNVIKDRDLFDVYLPKAYPLPAAFSKSLSWKL